VRVEHVHRERRLMVRAKRHEQLVTRRLRGARRSDQPADVFCSPEPGGEGRHLPDRVLGQQRGDRVDVVRLERCCPIPEQLLLRALLRCRDRPGAGIHVPPRLPKQLAHRRRGPLQRFGHRGIGQAGVVPQDERSALGRG
jgi:hypothetical protein